MSGMIWKYGAAFTFPLIALNAAQADSFTPPQGCNLEVTVQNRGCVVVQHYTCGNNPEDHQYRVIYDIDGLKNVTVSNLDSAVISASFPQLGGTVQYVKTPGDKPMSFKTLKDEGIDKPDYVIETTEGYGAGDKTRTFGTARLTDQSVVIDGKKLLRVLYEATLESMEGDFILRSEGNSYIDPETGKMYGESYKVSHWNSNTVAKDEQPIEFIFPGEDRVEVTTPKYGCERSLSRNSSSMKGADYEHS